MRVAILYRVVQEWRLPVFNRLANHEDIELKIFHGPDFKGTKVVSSKKKYAFESKQLTSLQLRGKSGNGNFFMPISIFLFFDLLRYNPKVVLTEGASNLFNAIVGFIYCKLFGRRYIWWSLGTLQNRGHSRLRRFLNIIIHYLERNADAIISYSNFGKKYFQEIGIDPKKIYVAVNVIDTDKKQAEIAQLDIQKIYNEAHSHHEFVVLFVGALTKVKKVDILINAFALLEKKYGSKVKLIIVGDGNHRGALEKLSQDKNIKNVEFTGKVFDGVSRYFVAADVFVLPGLGGLAVSEALVHGLPVIASVGDGCEKDLITNGENGIIDETLNAEKLFKYLDELKDNPQRLQQMKEKSLDVIANDYNINTYLPQVVRAIKNIE